MFTKDKICSSIKELKASPMTPQNTAILADLLYIAHHLDNAAAPDDVLAELTPEQAKSWVSGMENADGSFGPKWTMDQTEQVRMKQGVDCDPLKWWVTMNMMYSDYCKVAEKMGVNTLDFYACMAKAFLEDKDAQPEKLARYYEYIVQR